MGLKQTLAEQAALVAERPEVFEVQFTAGGFGWVVVQLDGIARDELAELTFEAWRLSAPARLVARARGAAAGLSRLTWSALEVRSVEVMTSQDLVHHRLFPRLRPRVGDRGPRAR